jgi:hypothetical protein
MASPFVETEFNPPHDQILILPQPSARRVGAAVAKPQIVEAL